MKTKPSVPIKEPDQIEALEIALLALIDACSSSQFTFRHFHRYHYRRFWR
jgi:hypothetical protein